MNKGTEILIRADSLVRTYVVGDVETHALAGVSLSIHKGEFIAITGKSGSGKSTLLYQLSLLDRPTSGAVYVLGEETSHWSSRRRADARLRVFGYVFQDYALVPELTALENIMLPYYMSEGFNDGGTERGFQLLREMDLEGKEHNLPSQLSGGEQQRVSIARALVNYPTILFADEPTANLDSETSERVMNIFEVLNKRGLTVVMVSHEREYAARASRILVMKDGKIISDSAN